MATMKDVAKKSGLSLATISKYFNGGKLRPSNKEKIVRAVDELGYEVNEAARVLKGGSSNKIGICLPSFELGYCRRVALEIQDMLENQGYDAPIYDCARIAEREERFLQRMLDKKAAGVITIPLNRNSQLYKSLKLAGIPVIAIANADANIFNGNVIVNNSEPTNILLDRLRENGHTRLGVIVGDIEYNYMSMTNGITLESLAARGFDSDPSLFFFGGDKAIASGCEGAAYFMAMEKRPTAILCFNGELAVGCRFALQTAGLKISRDISLCAILAQPWTENPLLSEIVCSCQHVNEIAKNAVNLMLNLSRNLTREEKVRTQALLSINASFKDGTSIGPVR